MNIIISEIDFWDSFDAMKYWTHPKSYSIERKREEAKNMVMSGEYIGSRKVDGVWSMIIRDEAGDFHLRSRTPNVNKTYADKAEWIPSITEELSYLPNGTVLLGEIYKFGDEGSRKTTSILNCLKDKSLERQANTPLHFYCFDCLAWAGDILVDTAIEKRIEYLKNIKFEGPVEVAEYKRGEELWALYLDVIAAGQEGIVIQKNTAPYTCGKRSARLSLKLKKELTDTIDAFLDGDYKSPTRDYTGKNLESWEYYINLKSGERLPVGNHFAEYTDGAPIIPVTKPFYLGYAGALSFSVMKDGKPEHLCYISGVSDNLKREIVQNPDKWIGKVFEISAMEIEEAPTSKIGYTLRHARVMGLREDKSPEECDFSQLL